MKLSSESIQLQTSVGAHLSKTHSLSVYWSCNSKTDIAGLVSIVSSHKSGENNASSAQ